MPEVPTINPLAFLMMFAMLASVVGAWVWVAIRFAFQMPVLPEFNPRVVPWGGKSVLAAILAWLALQVGLQFAFLFITHGTVGRPKEGQAPFTPSEMMVASAIQNAAVLVAIPLLLAATCHARIRDFVSSRSKTGWQILQGVMAWPLTVPVVYGTMLGSVLIWGKESHPLEKAIQREGVGGMAVVFFLAGAVFAPAAEELIFRGVLLGWLTRLVLKPRNNRLGVPEAPQTHGDTFSESNEVTTTVDLHPDADVSVTPVADWTEDHDNPFAPPRAAIEPAHPDDTSDRSKVDLPSRRGVMTRLLLANVAVSILFASLHAAVWPTPVPIFFLSLALGLLYQRTGSLVAPITLHMTFNGISTVLMFLTLGMNPQGAPKPSAPIPSPMPDPIPKKVISTIRPLAQSWAGADQRLV